MIPVDCLWRVTEVSASPLVVGIGDCKIGQAVRLVTYALGSCIAVALVDTEANLGGLLHFKLPEASNHQEIARENPFYFADLGIKAMLKGALELGLVKKRARVCLIGGAQMIDSGGLQIGKQNYLAARKALWKEGIMVHKEAIGGEKSRNVSLSSNGSIIVRVTGSHEISLLGPGSDRPATSSYSPIGGPK